MENLKICGNEEKLRKLIKFSEKENARVLISDRLINKFSECYTTSENKLANVINVVTSPFILAAGLISYQLERTNQKCKLASILDCSRKEIACSEGDFADRNGKVKTTMIGCTGDVNTKNIQKEGLRNLRVIIKDFYMESLSTEYFEQLDSVELIGGNLYLSDKNIEAYENNEVLPNLKHIGGKVLVNAKEYRM